MDGGPADGVDPHPQATGRRLSATVSRGAPARRATPIAEAGPGRTYRFDIRLQGELTALVAHGHLDELALHVRAAVRNGLTPDEIGAVLLQTAVYRGVPAANAAFAVARRTLAEPGDGEPPAPRTARPGTGRPARKMRGAAIRPPVRVSSLLRRRSLPPVLRAEYDQEV